MIEPLFSFYGDDFTGSTDALEALAANGVPSVLFVEPPDERRLSAFRDCRAIGIAGESRSRGPEWMSANLPRVFSSLKSYGAPLCQYKVCSTFDSSPEVGSIGRALEIGQETFGTPWVPIAVAAPHLRRYVLFGNLFAAGAGEIHRIDRHPTMRDHPVTPMEESDLRRHLARQTDRRIALLDILALQSADPEARLAAVLEQDPDGVLFDALDDGSLATLGRLLWTRRPAPQTFVIGSSGLTHALIQYWRKAGIIPGGFVPGLAGSVDRLIVVSGSCSPVTETQIRWSMAHGFEGLRIEAGSQGQGAVVDQAVAILARGRSVALYTALGPRDCVGSVRGEQLGCYLGEMLHELLSRTGVRRVLIAGGDTSTHAVRRLGVEALTFAALTTPGAPLCRCHSADAIVDGLEIVLKGGQVGPEDYFDRARRGDS
jgi:3-oxoisoapionate kinase